MALGGSTSLARLGAIAVAVTVGVVSCLPLVFPPFVGFSYALRVAPRVFASHHPLVPTPGDTLSIRVVPEVLAGTSVSHAYATLRRTSSESEKECVGGSDGSFTCTFQLGEAPGTASYHAHAVLSGGTRIRTRAEYRFTVGPLLDDNTLVPVRVPIKRIDSLLESYRIDTAFVRDGQNGYTKLQFLEDTEEALYQGILADPVYRWRDDQLGFYVYTRPGVTTSYYSRLDTRCGQNPWPKEANLPTPVTEMEVIGVLHRHATDASGAESRVPPGDLQNVFRDCAGVAVRSPSRWTFSTTARLPESPAIVRHEFGHAAFGLGDEYYETTASRNVLPMPPALLPSPCCCQKVNDGTGGGSTTGGTGTVARLNVPVGVPGSDLPKVTVECIKQGGGTEQPSFPPATTLVCSPQGVLYSDGIDPLCGAAPQGGCPPLAGNCVKPEMWLDPAAPTGSVTARKNVFSSEDECKTAKAAAEIHPAVEKPLLSLGSCRKLCGGTDGPSCPCPGELEAWIVDRHPFPKPLFPSSDAMGTAELRPLGGTCAWCVDTSLCVRWHRALGDSADQTWATCEAPPRSQTAFEDLLEALREWVEGLREWILRLLGLAV